jgi:hypothetical protein
MLLNKISSLGSTVKSLCLFWAKRWEARFLCFPFGQAKADSEIHTVRYKFYGKPQSHIELTTPAG